jgi:hypothetical protein
MLKKKKSQQEILGFVLIVLIVMIVGVIFLSLTLLKDKRKVETSVKYSSLLSSAMYHTSDCAINYIPQYKDIQELIKECYNNPERKCVANINCEKEVIVKKDNIGTRFSFNSHQGPYEDVFPEGNAQEPLLVKYNLMAGQKIYISDITGTIKYKDNDVDCKNGPAEGAPGYPGLAGFYDDNSKKISEYSLKSFQGGIDVPEGATRLYAYIKDDKKGYKDNFGGECIFYLKGEKDEEIVTKTKVPCKTDNKIRTVCEVLNQTLKEVIETSLIIDEESPTKAYTLKIKYAPGNNVETTSEFISLEKGIFKNCTTIRGGKHSIAVSTSSSGFVNVELDVCQQD